MKVSIDEVLKTDKICEASICYSGDLSSPSEKKYTLDYYLKMAEKLEKMGVHFLAIKDMAGLCKPKAAKVLFKELKKNIKIPIHFHTHDTSGNGVATILNASDSGVDIVDLAIDSWSGFTDQLKLYLLFSTISSPSKFCKCIVFSLKETSQSQSQIFSYMKSLTDQMKEFILKVSEVSFKILGFA